MTPISDLLDKIDQSTQAYTFNGYAALSHSIEPALILSFTAYIAFLGWSFIAGWSPFNLSQLIKHILKIAIVFAAATQWDVFSLYVYNVLSNGPNEISSILMQSAGSSQDSVNSALQDAFNEGVIIGEQIYNYHGLSTKLAAIVIWILNFVVCGIALLELAVAKCGLAITLVLAPIFFPFLLWDGTKGIFQSWLKYAFGFGLVPLFLSASLLLIDQIMKMGLDQINASIQSASLSITSIVSFVLASIASIGLLLRSASIAAHVAGGAAVSGLEAARSFSSGAYQFSGLSSVNAMLKKVKARKRDNKSRFSSTSTVSLRESKRSAG